ncbi:MAG: ATP phosphoribosyltransferase [Sphaerochaeta sp.]
MLNIALPKGRLGEKAYRMLAKAGFDCSEVLSDSRKLIFTNEKSRVRFFWVKPSDICVYVERGAADIGIAGKDIIVEYGSNVYELLDLKIGKCGMCVAAAKGFRDNHDVTLRVATKFPNIARQYYASIGREIDIIRLNGSIELAPVLGLSDVIVDIVETGTTLKENGLEVTEKIIDISARLIANKASFEFKKTEILKVAAGLRSQSEGKND